MPVDLSEFHSKIVPGLYSYAHFEHENGTFIQVKFGSEKPLSIVYCGIDHVFHYFNSKEELKTFLATL